jgi:hypothetical protein
MVMWDMSEGHFVSIFACKPEVNYVDYMIIVTNAQEEVVRFHVTVNVMLIELFPPCQVG